MALVLLVTVHAGLSLRPRASVIRAPTLLSLRGGAQPASIERSSATLPKRPKRAAKTKPQSPSDVGIRDVAVVGLCLATAAAAHLYAEPLMATVPPNLKSHAWLLFGGTFATTLYVVVRLFNYPRAMGIDRALCRLLVGTDPKGLARLIPPALLFVLGSGASAQTLPSNAG